MLTVSLSTAEGGSGSVHRRSHPPGSTLLLTRTGKTVVCAADIFPSSVAKMLIANLSPERTLESTFLPLAKHNMLIFSPVASDETAWGLLN